MECDGSVYLSIDDAIVEKKQPSSKAKRSMEGTGWHHSHPEGKQVFGYQIFGSRIGAESASFCYSIRLDCTENGSKIDMVVQLLDNLPETEAHVIAFLSNDQYHLVTVGGHEYWTYRNEGPFTGVKNAVVLLSYPKNSFGNKQALRLFLCSNLTLSDEEILAHYTHHWKIEVMFKQHKMYLGLKPVMVRSAKAIDCLLCLSRLISNRYSSHQGRFRHF